MFFVVNGRSTASPEMELIWFGFAFGSASLADDRVPLLRLILRVTHGRVYTDSPPQCGTGDCMNSLMLPPVAWQIPLVVNYPAACTGGKHCVDQGSDCRAQEASRPIMEATKRIGKSRSYLPIIDEHCAWTGDPDTRCGGAASLTRSCRPAR